MNIEEFEIPVVEEPVVPLYHNEVYLGNITSEIQLLYTLLEIRDYNEEGFYFVFNDQKIEVNPQGKIKNPPRGFYDQYERVLMELAGF